MVMFISENGIVAVLGDEGRFVAMARVLVDREYASLVPKLTGEERTQLEENLLREGCRDPLVVWNNVILDGHNRYDICSRHNLPFQVVERPFNTRREAKAWIIRNQLGRRNLTPYARAVLALKLKEEIGAKARAKMLAGGKGLPSLGDPVRTDKELAGLAGVSHGTLHKVETIEGKAPPSIRSMARRGEISIHRAYSSTKSEGNAASGAMDVRILPTTGSNEWYTPEPYIEAVHQLFGGIDVDPASNHLANEVVRAKVYYSKTDDGLNRSWPGRVFLNPPYRGENGAGSQGMWTSRLLWQYQDGTTIEAVLLVCASTECKWFHPLWDYPICFTDHRIRFYGPGGTAGQPTHGSAFVYLGHQVERFADIFTEFGVIAMRLR